jgi:hypothetical protein
VWGNRAWWLLFNVVMGIPSAYALVWAIFKVKGFMTPSTGADKLVGGAVLILYMAVWVGLNLILHRRSSDPIQLKVLWWILGVLVNFGTAIIFLRWMA